MAPSKTEPIGSGSPPVTELLLAWKRGDEHARDALIPLVYAELRTRARNAMRGENAGHLLQTTALIHEAYVRLVGVEVDWQHRGHFFAVAAGLMRRILVDFARAQRTAKRGGQWLHFALDEENIPPPERPDDMIRLDDALEAMAAFDPRKVQVIELRFFAGMTIAETADALEISHATVERDLKAAKAWLIRELDTG